MSMCLPLTRTSLRLSPPQTIALCTTDLGVVISLSGACCSTILIFIAPGACYWSLHRRRPLTARRAAAGALFVVGCVLLPLLVVLVLASRGYLGAEWELES